MSYELRPLSLAEILDAAFRLVQTEWRTLVGLSMIMQLPLMLLANRASWLFDPFANVFEPGEEPTPELLMEMGLVFGGMGLTYLILYPFVAAAVTAAVGNFYLGRRFEIRDAARAGLASLLRLVLAYVVYILALGLGMAVVGGSAAFLGGVVLGVLGQLGTAGNVLAILGGVGFGLAFFVAVCFVTAVSALLAPVVVLESKGIFATVSRTIQVAPVRFTSRTACHASRDIVTMSPVLRSLFTSNPSRRIPALLITPVRPPICSCAQSTKAAVSASSTTFSARVCTLPAIPSHDRASSASPSSFTSPAATCCPF